MEGAGRPVLIRRGEAVELVCRPADDQGCRWNRRGGDVLSDECLLSATKAGVYQCSQGGTLVGSVELKISSETTVYPYRQEPDYRIRHSSAYQEKERKRRANAHMCSDTGTLIEQSLLCDGEKNCNNGEDERSCSLPCGAPSVGGGSSLTTPVGQLYPHGATVTYTCPAGSSFRQTLGELRRKCHQGRWSDSPPTCHRNLAFGRATSAFPRSALLGLGSELAVDGQVSTWTMLTPSEGTQSLNVTLDDGVSVDLVLVRTLSASYSVYLNSGSSWTECQRDRNRSRDDDLAGLAAFTCPSDEPTGAGDGGPLILEVLSSAPGLTSLSISEIAAFEPLSPANDTCELLDQPANGRYERTGDSSVRLVCDEGYRASCAGDLPCSEAASAVCRPLTCPPPPTIPRATTVSSNGTRSGAVTEYQCSAGYQLYPESQRTIAECRGGLWSLSHISCLPESDLRVVALRLGRQHSRSVAALGAELERLVAGQQQLLRRLEGTQRRLRQVEQMLDINWEELEEEGHRLDSVEGKQEETLEPKEEVVDTVQEKAAEIEVEEMMRELEEFEQEYENDYELW
ncbi:hypothetical protein FJT64_005386 [Amphibalanus amphitrite]|uniref:Uncharacterized protein n=1 Tax=Amphibalanus amphitrite TaxID=1232801 RepID=A0A6A4W0F8_AMPAM|nr:hypothetical protein FJT64_005386 [Amphibalanus amphitrite]